MLLELAVENLAVVERVRLRFHAGFNVLTGETGSGKSLLVDALGLLFGARASADLIRAGAARCAVSGIFEVPDDKALRRLLDDAGIAAEDGELLLEREILPGGKSRAWAASRPVTTALLRDLAPFLGDIHGQHDQQRLFSAEAQRELLDQAAEDDAALEAVAAAYGEWRAAAGELAELDRMEQENLRLADLWTMQAREIGALELAAGEDAALENERRVLKNVARLQENAQAAYDALSESDAAAVAAIGSALKRAEELARIDQSMTGLAETLRPALIGVEEAAHELRHYLSRLEADPARLEAAETRLAAIERLKRKYGGTIEEILRFHANVTARLAAVEHAGERREALRARIAALETEYRERALKLRALRQRAARKLEKQVEAELGGLAMKGAAFRVSLGEAEPAAHGMDAVEFLVSANPGEPPRPLEKVASGGELSRIALAVKTCLAARPRAGVARTLVFDEVDAGVGGAAAEMVGRRLRQIAAADQVLCVTHLAQIAGFAARHYAVEKRESGGRAVAAVRELEPAERAKEVARMLSGRQVTAEALAHAEKLLAAYAR